MICASQDGSLIHVIQDLSASRKSSIRLPVGSLEVVFSLINYVGNRLLCIVNVVGIGTARQTVVSCPAEFVLL